MFLLGFSDVFGGDGGSTVGIGSLCGGCWVSVGVVLRGFFSCGEAVGFPFAFEELSFAQAEFFQFIHFALEDALELDVAHVELNLGKFIEISVKFID